MGRPSWRKAHRETSREGGRSRQEGPPGPGLAQLVRPSDQFARSAAGGSFAVRVPGFPAERFGWSPEPPLEPEETRRSEGASHGFNPEARPSLLPHRPEPPSSMMATPSCGTGRKDVRAEPIAAETASSGMTRTPLPTRQA